MLSIKNTQHLMFSIFLVVNLLTGKSPAYPKSVILEMPATSGTISVNPETRTIESDLFKLSWNLNNPEFLSSLIFKNYSPTTELTGYWLGTAGSAYDDEISGNSWAVGDPQYNGIVVVGRSQTGTWQVETDNSTYALVKTESTGVQGFPVETQIRVEANSPFLTVKRIFKFSQHPLNNANGFRPYMLRFGSFFDTYVYSTQEGPVTHQINSCGIGCEVSDWDGEWADLEYAGNMGVAFKDISARSSSLWADFDNNSKSAYLASVPNKTSDQMNTDYISTYQYCFHLGGQEALKDCLFEPKGFSRLGDEYNKTSLNPHWYWLNEDASKWSLTDRPGYIRINATQGEFKGNNAPPRNILVQPITSRMFEIDTKLDFNPTTNFQQGGLIIFVDSQNFIKMGITYNSAECSGKIADFRVAEKGILSPVNCQPVSSSQPAYLKLIRSGDLITGYYSSDGRTFKQIGSTVSSGLSIIKVGLYAYTSDAGAPDINIDFDYFRIAIQDGIILSIPFIVDNPVTAIQGNLNGKGPGSINSYFDHQLTYGNLMRYDGEEFTNLIGIQNCILGAQCYDGHNGIDFKKLGVDEKIYAAASGKVYEIKNDCSEGYTDCGNQWGNHVRIDHGGGYATLYAHLKQGSIPDTIKVGTIITDPASQPIGVIGNTGSSFGTHLHFSVFYDWNNNGTWDQSEAIDPFGWNPAEPNKLDPWTTPSHFLWQASFQKANIISQAGGEIISPVGTQSVVVPPGALVQLLTLEIWNLPPVAPPDAGSRSLGSSIQFSVSEWTTGGTGLNSANLADGFIHPLTLAMTFDINQAQHLNASQIQIVQWDSISRTWKPLNTILDVQGRTASAEITSPGNFDLQAPLFCQADTLEDNDSYDSSSPLSLNVLTNSLLDDGSDVDWYQFKAVTGATYHIQAATAENNFTLKSELYNLDGSTLIQPFSQSLDWTAPKSGIYYVRLSTDSSLAATCNAAYLLNLISNLQTIYLPQVAK